MNEPANNKGTVHATLLQTEQGWKWSVIYRSPYASAELVSTHRNVYDARSAAWQFALDHGATFVSNKKGAPS